MRHTRSIFDELPGVSSGNGQSVECLLLLHKQMILEGEIKNAKMSSFPLISTHSLNIKMESIRKLSNLNFQWTKTLYQNN